MFTTRRTLLLHTLLCWVAIAAAIAMVSWTIEGLVHRSPSAAGTLDSRVRFEAAVYPALWLLMMIWALNYENPYLRGARRRRTKGVRSAIKRLHEGAAGSAAEELGDDLKRRRSAWRQGKTRPRGYVELVSLMHVYPRAGFLFWTGLMAGPAWTALRPASPTGLSATMTALVPFAVLGLMACGLAVPKRILRRMDRTIDQELCPDCGYPLAQIPGEVPPEHSGGVNVGPRRCPECGCPWPLVPPPLEDKATR